MYPMVKKSLDYCISTWDPKNKGVVEEPHHSKWSSPLPPLRCRPGIVSPVEEVEEAIRPGGLGKQKAPRIQAILERLGEHPDLDWTETAPREESLEFLLSLPGVGRKTAACVLIFTWGIPEIPVDVHVHRVGGRLGLFPAKASFERAHDEMLAIVDPEDAYELHMNLIRHGREVCRPKPRCGECALRRMCPWYRAERKWHARQMSKKTFIVFGLLVLVLAALIPWLVFRADGDAARGAAEGAGRSEGGQSLFQTNCGTCHTLYAAGTDGNFGPDLDELLAPPARRKARPPRKRSRRPKAASSTRSKKASTAARRRAGCPAASSTASRPKKSPNSSPAPPARAERRRPRPQPELRPIGHHR